MGLWVLILVLPFNLFYLFPVFVVVPLGKDVELFVLRVQFLTCERRSLPREKLIGSR